jgi:hypothetical protein
MDSVTYTFYALVIFSGALVIPEIIYAIKLHIAKRRRKSPRVYRGPHA